MEKAEERGSCNQSSNKRHFPRERRPALNRKRHYRSTPAASSIILTRLIYVCLFLVAKLKKQEGGKKSNSCDLLHHQRLYRLWETELLKQVIPSLLSKWGIKQLSSCSPEGGDYGETYLTNSDALVSLKATIQASYTAVFLGIATCGKSFI